MTTLSQSQANDIIAINGLLSVSGGKTAYGNIIADAIRTLEGELQLDTDAGIPYQRTIWNNSNSISIWKHYVNEKVMSFPFVNSITSFDVSVSGNILTYRLVIETDEGTLVVVS